jgi:uncharacterized protein (TIGR02145 family)
MVLPALRFPISPIRHTCLPARQGLLGFFNIQQFNLTIMKTKTNQTKIKVMSKALIYFAIYGLLTAYCLLPTAVFAQGVAINTTGAAADSSAMLDVSSTTKGILIPRITEAQKLAITSPATGLLIYQTDNAAGFWYFNGTIWVQSITGTQGTTGATGATGATGLAGDHYNTTSTSCLTIGQASYGFIVGIGLDYSIGQTIIIAYAPNPNIKITAVVTSYDSNTGYVNVSVSNFIGSGQYCAWSVNLGGASGETGATGATGIQGITGITGADSQVAGTTGATGVNGSNGAPGAAGANGTTGATGANGSTGTTGVTGADGSNGSNGSNGAAGATGPTGAGLQGATGPSGVDGATGPTGVGVQGATGTPGDNGTPGATGASGTNGTNGTNGATGSNYVFSACGGNVSDIDGNSYNTVSIGTQCWMRKNLTTTHYKNNTAITIIAAGASGVPGWTGNTTGAYCKYYDATHTDSTANFNTYGALYNWYAVNNANGLCPSGWHVPSHNEWTTLEKAVCTSSADYFLYPYDTTTTGYPASGNEGLYLKEAGTVHWTTNSGTIGTNTSGFTALPGGCRHTVGSFSGVGYAGYWWTATESGATAWYRYLNYNYAQVTRFTHTKAYGFSVRCVKDY